MEEDLGSLGVQELAAAAAACVRAEIAAGCRLLMIAAVWADTHPADGVFHERTPLAIAGERTMRFGGEGTPDIAEFAPAELGLEIAMNPHQATALVADAVDLRHRFPRLWQRVCAADLPAWQARRIAASTRQLSMEQAASIDDRLAGCVGQLSLRRLDNLLDAEILRVDQQRVQQQAAAASRQRMVWLGRSTAHGVRDLHARMDAPDANGLLDTADRLADILMEHPDQLPPGVPDRNAQSKDEWRTVALAVLGRPLIAARVFLEQEQPRLLDGLEPAPDDGNSGGVGDEAEQWAAGENDRSKTAAEDVQPSSGEPLEQSLRRIDPTKLAPRAVLHVHISAGALRDDAEQVARVEKIGPALLTWVRGWLTACRVTVQPVIDCDQMPAVDAYEVPGRMHEALLTRSPGSVFPWSSGTGRRLDLDHTTPYRPPPEGPPGQTGLPNLGPLTRPEHRFKTFGDVAVRQPAPGTFVWRTRSGRVIITNPSGTHDLGLSRFAGAVWKAAQGTGLPSAA